MKKFLRYIMAILTMGSGATLVFGTFIYILTGLNIFPSPDGSRWIALILLTLAFGFLYGMMAIPNYYDDGD